ncbi:MAG: D-2-hydroxyacid dehydrogenase [Candidatus Rokuibacteriota bacterium]
MSVKVLVVHQRADEYRGLMRRRFPELEVIAEPQDGRLEQGLAEAEFMIAWRHGIEALARARRLRWLQLTSAGVEHLLPVRALLRDVIVTNARGIHGEVMADYVFGVIVMQQWNFPRLFRNQQARCWDHQFTEPLAGKTLGVIGLGAIGREIVRRAPAFGMTVVGVKREAAPVDGVSRVFGPDRLAEMLPLCDFVVVVVPDTPETRQMIGARELRAMKPTAYLINIARGSVVDEPALVRALREGWIAGAALDVFAQEPLPPESPLWTLDRVILTPHIAGEPADYVGRVMDIFGENLARWRDGRPLRNVVDLAKGY